MLAAITHVTHSPTETANIIDGVVIIGGATFLTFIAKQVRDAVRWIKKGASTAFEVKEAIFGRDQTDDEKRNNIPAPVGLAYKFDKYHEKVVDLTEQVTSLDSTGRRAIAEFEEIKETVATVVQRLDDGATRFEAIDRSLADLSSELKRNGGDTTSVGDTLARIESAVMPATE